MNVVLLRVGIDTGSGGIHGPVFKDRSFEFMWIPGKYRVEHRTYGSLVGRHGTKLVDYFPERKRCRALSTPVHVDPEFETFTYGDPKRPKASLRRLHAGDLLVFYCGLEGWDFRCDPALYVIGYFCVQTAGRAAEFGDSTVKDLFAANAHVRHHTLYQEQKDRLVLVKGSGESRLLKKAVRISTLASDRSGKPLHVLSSEMQKVFGDFEGKISIQRSPPRWVRPAFRDRAASFVRSLR